MQIWGYKLGTMKSALLPDKEAFAFSCHSCWGSFLFCGCHLFWIRGKQVKKNTHIFFFIPLSEQIDTLKRKFILEYWQGWIWHPWIFHVEFCGKCKLLAWEPAVERSWTAVSRQSSGAPSRAHTRYWDPRNRFRTLVMRTAKGEGSVWEQLNPSAFPHILAEILALKICPYRNHQWS